MERLKREAEDLWEHQQDVLKEARKLAREAGHHAGDFTRKEVAPRVRGAYTSGISALGSAIATVQAFRDKQVRDALSGVGRVRFQSPVYIAAPPPPPKAKVGRWVLLGIGIVAAGAVGYAVWQTLRADDDLWIEDESSEALEPAPTQETAPVI